MCYADDLAIISIDLTSIDKAITIIENWTSEYNMSLIKRKSGI